MFAGMKQKELILIYAAVGFGSVALVGLGEISGSAPGSPFQQFYLQLIFGGFIVFYAVFIHFGTLGLSRRIDQSQRNKLFKYLFGEKSSYLLTLAFIFGVLVYWIFAIVALATELGLDFL